MNFKNFFKIGSKILVSIILIILGWSIGKYHLLSDIYPNNHIRPNATVHALSKKVTPSPKKTTAPVMPTVTPVIITYDTYGFTPNIIKIPVDTPLIITNTSKGPMVFEGLPNQPNNIPQLNQGIIEVGQKKTFTIHHPGVWQFMNGNEPSDRGIIIVK